MTITNSGFETTHYYKSRFVGRSDFNMTDHFGWTWNSDGTVTISADRVKFNKYSIGRGMMESLTNAYASAKKFGLAACTEMFTDRLTDLYNGVISSGGAKKKAKEVEIDLFATTLHHVMFSSLIKEYKIKINEAQALAKSIDFASEELARRTGKKSQDIRLAWETTANEELAALSEELEIDEDESFESEEESDDHATA